MKGLNFIIYVAWVLLELCCVVAVMSMTLVGPKNFETNVILMLWAIYAHAKHRGIHRDTKDEEDRKSKV